MGKEDKLTVYVGQRSVIVRALEEGRTHFVKLKYIKEKYMEVADVFLFVYDWYRENAQKILQKPDEAESGIWGFTDIKYLDEGEDIEILELCVPKNELLCFSMADWSKLLNMGYIGTPEEEKAYDDELSKNGIMYKSDVCLTPFYPVLKRKVMDSWSNLFRYDEQIKSGDILKDTQVGMWQIKPEWVKRNITKEKMALK